MATLLRKTGTALEESQNLLTQNQQVISHFESPQITNHSNTAIRNGALASAAVRLNGRREQRFSFSRVSAPDEHCHWTDCRIGSAPAVATSGLGVGSSRPVHPNRGK
jgi:hypothetical protein